MYLHIGLAKTGTTYLQEICSRNRRLMRRRGVLYPPGNVHAHFHASLDVRQARFIGHTYSRADGAWDTLVRQVKRHAGPSLVSHETFAIARPAHIEKIVSDLAPHQVEVVITARDLARQIPAVWQENVKNSSVQAYDTWLPEVLGREAVRRSFWRAQDLPKVARRFAQQVGSEHVTVVTVPQSGAPRDLLWQRFSEAVDLPDADYELSIEGANASLGAVEAELLRRLNPRLLDGLEWSDYVSVAKHRFAEHDLPSGHDTKLRVPAEHLDAVRREADRAADRVAAAGYRVVGDLDELRVAGPPDGGVYAPPTDSELLECALRLIADGVVDRARPPSVRATATETVRRMWSRGVHS